MSEETPATLHGYFRSSTSVRLRAALNLKSVDVAYEPKHLRHGGQRDPAYLAINPQGLVPSLTLSDGTVLTQSLAIIEWLDETHPDPPLLPADAIGRARVRSIAYAVACEIHPVNNLRVLQYLKDPLGHDQETVTAWFRHWVGTTFQALETRLSREAETGRFCHGDAPGLADICLFAQVLNNRRFDVDMTPYPTIARIHGACLEMPAFQNALPERQPDAE